MRNEAARNEHPAGAHAPAFNPRPRPQPVATAFCPLDAEVREVISTGEAAYHLNRRPQTLRGWSCLGNGPIQPVRVNGRLGWRTADIRRLLGVDHA